MVWVTQMWTDTLVVRPGERHEEQTERHIAQ